MSRVLAAIRYGGESDPDDDDRARSNRRRDQRDPELTNDYTQPSDANGLYAALYGGLDAFDRDMQEHIEFENNLPYPGVGAMEEKACTREEWREVNKTEAGWV